MKPILPALYSTILGEKFNYCNYKFSLEHNFGIIFAIIKGTKSLLFKVTVSKKKLNSFYFF